MRSIKSTIWNRHRDENKETIHTYLCDEIDPHVKCEKNGLGDQITREGDIIRKLRNLNSSIGNDGNYIIELTACSKTIKINAYVEE